MAFIRKNWPLFAGGILLGVGVGLLALSALGIERDLSNIRVISFGGESYLAPEEKQPAADFTLEDLSGIPVNLEELEGRPVVVNFWASWCGPCRNEMPLLEAYFMDYQDNLVILGVNAGEPADTVRPYVEELGLTFPILLDSKNEVYSLYRVRGMPTTFFLDADGIIRFQHIGELSEAQLADYLERIGVDL